MALNIYYDGECPFCTRYVRMLRLSRVSDVALIDLRERPLLREELESEGFDLDRGMVVEQDGRRVGGANAVNALALLSTPSDWLNRLNRTVLASPLAARMLYPLLRLGRWLALFLLGRDQMAAADAGQEGRRTMFATLFALFSVFHFMNYAFEYDRFPPQWDQLSILAAAVLLFFRPSSSRALFLLMLASTISAILQAPINSNHTMVRNAVLLGYWFSLAATAVRNKPPGAVFSSLAPAGQGTLLVMYVFGVFHKINSDFLNPETSCAVELWRLMPMPLSAMQGPLVWNAAIYGTFVVEGAIVLALLVRRWRHVGVTLGILFHLLLSLSDYAMYLSFTTLSIALHALFLNGEAARNILASREMRFVQSRMREPIYLIAVFTLMFGLAALAYHEHYTVATLFALPLVLPFCFIVLRHGRSLEPLAAKRTFLPWVGIAITTLFFFNAAAPYFGLKTAQTINMFANLRLEGGTSNHLILRNPPGPFDYLEKVAIIEDSGGDAELRRYERADTGIVYYELLSILSRKPGVRITYRMDGRTYENVSREDLQPEMAATLHHPWIRKWFHFVPAALERPQRCRN